MPKSRSARKQGYSTHSAEPPTFAALEGGHMTRLVAFRDVLEHLGARNLHRPSDAAQLAEAVRTLAAEGWHPQDIARHLRLDAGFVRGVLEREP